MTFSRPTLLHRLGRAISELLAPASKAVFPVRELDPDRVRALTEMIAEVRFGAFSLPRAERRMLVDGRNSIISSRLRAEARVGEGRAE